MTKRLKLGLAIAVTVLMALALVTAFSEKMAGAPDVPHPLAERRGCLACHRVTS